MSTAVGHLFVSHEVPQLQVKKTLHNYINYTVDKGCFYLYQQENVFYLHTIVGESDGQQVTSGTGVTVLDCAETVGFDL